MGAEAGGTRWVGFPTRRLYKRAPEGRLLNAPYSIPSHPGKAGRESSLAGGLLVPVGGQLQQRFRRRGIRPRATEPDPRRRCSACVRVSAHSARIIIN